jgi:hypothetical protein
MKFTRQAKLIEVPDSPEFLYQLRRSAATRKAFTGWLQRRRERKKFEADPLGHSPLMVVKDQLIRDGMNPQDFEKLNSLYLEHKKAKLESAWNTGAQSQAPKEWWGRSYLGQNAASSMTKPSPSKTKPAPKSPPDSATSDPAPSTPKPKVPPPKPKLVPKTKLDKFEAQLVEGKPWLVECTACRKKYDLRSIKEEPSEKTVFKCTSPICELYKRYWTLPGEAVKWWQQWQADPDAAMGKKEKAPDKVKTQKVSRPEPLEGKSDPDKPWIVRCPKCNAKYNLGKQKEMDEPTRFLEAEFKCINPKCPGTESGPVRFTLPEVTRNWGEKALQNQEVELDYDYEEPGSTKDENSGTRASSRRRYEREGLRLVLAEGY